MSRQITSEDYFDDLVARLTVERKVPTERKTVLRVRVEGGTEIGSGASFPEQALRYRASRYHIDSPELRSYLFRNLQSSVEKKSLIVLAVSNATYTAPIVVQITPNDIVLDALPKTAWCSDILALKQAGVKALMPPAE